MTRREKLREIVMQLAGSASMCWKPIPKGKFDSSNAIVFSDEAIKEIEKLYGVDEEKKKNDNLQCPVCGYYCLGKGGYGCIDKPFICGYKKPSNKHGRRES